MWILFALAAAILTGCGPILGARPSRMLGAGRIALIRAGIVLIGSGLLVLLNGGPLPFTDTRAWAIFTAAGLADALAWLFFYRALADGSLEDAVIREKFCVPLSILLSCTFAFRLPSWLEWAAILLFVGGIVYGTRKSRSVLPFLSAACTAIQIQLSKMGIERLGSEITALFLRSVFSLVFLFVFAKRRANRPVRGLNSDQSHSGQSQADVPSDEDGALILWGQSHNGGSGRPSGLSDSLLCVFAGLCALFAWIFTFSALKIASAAQVQAVTKLNFWITGLYLAIRTRSVHRQRWFAYAAMTVGTLVLLA